MRQRCPTTQASAPTPPTQTPKRTHPKRKHETPPPTSKHAHSKPHSARHPREHKTPTPNVWALTSVSTGTRVQKKGRPARNEAQTHEAGTQTAHTTKRKQPGLRQVCACARQRGQREKRAGHNSPRQSAWVVVFVGVFADVCRLFWLVGFGGLGVFWGCLACFLVF